MTDQAAIDTELAAAKAEAKAARDYAGTAETAATSARQAAERCLVRLDNLAVMLGDGDGNGGGGVEPGEPDLERGRICSLPAPTSVPIDLPAGTLAGVATICMVVKVQVTTGRHKKFIGCASTQSAGQGAFGIGVSAQGKTDVWRAGGGQQNPFSPQYNFPARQAVMLFWQVAGDEMAFGFDGATTELATPLVASDGAGAIGAGYWAGQRADPIAPEDEIRACDCWDRVLTEAEIALWQEQHAHLEDEQPDPAPGNGGGNGGGGNGGGNGGGGGNGDLEPVDPSAHQVTITVDPAPRQSWIGMGWGCNSAIGGSNSPAAVVLPRLKSHIRKVTEDIGATVIRIFTLEAADQYMQYYKPYWDLARQHGVDTVFASCYIFTANPDRAPSHVAEGVAKYKAAGMPITALSLQNEPDGNPKNAITGGAGAYVGYLRGTREELDRRGCQSTKVLGFEWRHPTGGQWNGNGAGEVEFDAIASIVPSHVYGGCLHIYDKGPGPNLYDNRWLKKGAPLWSTETGNNGSPSAQARFIGGLNNGCEAEILHYVMIATASPNNEQLGQSFLDWNGQPRPWWAGYGAIARNLERGATFRLCRSNDRPPGMPAGQAERMAILAPRQPRALVAAAKTRGGKWQVVAVNSTHGGDASSIHAGGHYGALRQQITVSLPDKIDGTFHGHRATQAGGSGTAKAVMRAGVSRFTLTAGETIGMTQA